MKIIFSFILIFSFIFNLKCQKLEPGKIIDTVVCIESPDQSYAVYIPSYYSTDTSWPIIYLFDPAARGKLAVDLFSSAAEQYGYIVLCSNNSRNGPWDPINAAAEAMFMDAEERFSIDEQNIFIGGFSGGARSAVRLAMLNRSVDGVIGCGAGFPVNYAPQSGLKFLYLGIVGNQDYNYNEMFALHHDLDSLNVPNLFIVFNGRHDWPPEDIVTEAFFRLRPPDQSITDNQTGIFFNFPETDPELISIEFDEQDEVITVLNEIKWNFIRKETPITNKSWWNRKIKDYTKLTENEDAPLKLMGHRLLEYVWAQAWYNFELYYETEQYELSLEYAKLGVNANPGSWYPHFLLALNYIKLNDNQAAIKEIEQALLCEDADIEYIINNDAIQKLKDIRQFNKLLNKYVQ